MSDSIRISIFVAGATALKAERDSIKTIANDLNSEFASRKVHIIIRTYEHFGENQKEYDRFISDETDLILFILDGRIGEKTRDELLLASENKDKNGHPKIMVFLRAFSEENAEIGFIRGLLLKTTGEYYVPYTDVESLKKEAEKRIRRFILQKLEKPAAKTVQESPETSATTKPASAARRSFIAILLLVAVLVGFVVGEYFARAEEDAEPEPVLLVAGGGSAANIVKAKHPEIDLSDFNGSYYVHLPSRNALQLLTEEVISPESDSCRRYYPVCLSAEEAAPEAFLSNIITKEAFMEKGYVLAVQLEPDTLAIYVKNSPEIKKTHALPDAISTKELATLTARAKEIGVNVFCTSPNSGTRNTYARIVEPLGGDLSEVFTFSEDSDMANIDRDGIPYALLGSCYYSAKSLKENLAYGTAVKLIVYDEDENGKMTPVTKPTFLYCMTSNKGSGVLEIPGPTLDFINALGIDTSGKIKDGKLNRPYNKVVIKFEDLRNFVEK